MKKYSPPKLFIDNIIRNIEKEGIAEKREELFKRIVVLTIIEHIKKEDGNFILEITNDFISNLKDTKFGKRKINNIELDFDEFVKMESMYGNGNKKNIEFSIGELKNKIYPKEEKIKKETKNKQKSPEF